MTWNISWVPNYVYLSRSMQASTRLRKNNFECGLDSVGLLKGFV